VGVTVRRASRIKIVVKMAQSQLWKLFFKFLFLFFGAFSQAVIRPPMLHIPFFLHFKKKK
jgi:hypothetical protein